MPLSIDQQVALKNCQCLFNGSQREHVLTGGPGMGKSYLTASIIEAATNAGFQILLAATTHPAVAVLQDFTGKEAFTFHKIFDLKVDEDYATGVTNTYQAIGKEGPMLQQLMWSSHCLLIIDEASYLDDHHYGFIEQALDKYPSLVILYVGDKDQLPPVGSEDPYIFNIGLPTSQLVTDHRFASDSQIADITNQLKQNIRDKSYFLIDVDTGKDITIMDDSEFLAKMEELYSSREYQDDPFWVKSVAYRNSTVDSMNSHIRAYYYDDPLYQPGERLLVNKALSRKKRIVVNNGDVITVMKNEPIELHGVKGQNIEFRAANGNRFSAVVTPHYRKKATVKKELIKKQNWAQLYEFVESFIEVKPIYASTIHKAQGASYKNVMLHLEDLVACQDHTLLARLLLVAISRASKHVYVYGTVPDNLKRSKK